MPVLFFPSFSSLQRDHKFLNTFIKDFICSVSTGAKTTSLKFTDYNVSVWEDEKVLDTNDGDGLRNNVNVLML